jgi:hypothetical protein
MCLVLACEKNILVTVIRVRGGVHTGELYLDTLQKPRGMSWLMCERHCSICGFANLRKPTVTCSMSVCPTDIPNGTSQLPVDGFLLNLTS